MANKVFFEGLKLSVYAKAKIRAEKRGGRIDEDDEESDLKPNSKLLDSEIEFKGEIVFSKFEGDFIKLYLQK